MSDFELMLDNIRRSTVGDNSDLDGLDPATRARRLAVRRSIEADLPRRENAVEQRHRERTEARRQEADAAARAEAERAQAASAQLTEAQIKAFAEMFAKLFDARLAAVFDEMIGARVDEKIAELFSSEDAEDGTGEPESPLLGVLSRVVAVERKETREAVKAATEELPRDFNEKIVALRERSTCG
jgi:hypothetical protein